MSWPQDEAREAADKIESLERELRNAKDKLRRIAVHVSTPNFYRQSHETLEHVLRIAAGPEVLCGACQISYMDFEKEPVTLCLDTIQACKDRINEVSERRKKMKHPNEAAEFYHQEGMGQAWGLVHELPQYLAKKGRTNEKGQQPATSVRRDLLVPNDGSA